MKKCTLAIISLCLVLSSAWAAETVELRDDHPEFYVVKKGDTLWDISAMFLKSPWLWPEIWHANTQVDNPHLIFPGDVLSLVYVDGQPRIVRGNRFPDGTIKLTPKARVLSQGDAIPTIPLDAIQAFLSGSRVMSPEEMAGAPYVIGNEDGRMVAAHDNKVYVRGLAQVEEDKYSFYKEGDVYRDPETDEHLGIQAIYLGTGQRKVKGDPAVVMMQTSEQEITRGALVFPTNDEDIRPVYMPHSPDNMVDASIISVFGGVSQIGQYDVVVINRGERENMEVGHVLTIFKRGEVIADEVATERRKNDPNVGGWTKFVEGVTNKQETVKLPDEEAGTMMIFRVFDKVSLGLVLKATKPIHIRDVAKTPS